MNSYTAVTGDSLGVEGSPENQLDITTTSLSDGTVIEAYSATLQATGGTPPYTSWTITVGVLPAGLSLDPSTGEILGTPTTAETQNFTVTVTDADNPSATDSQDLSIAVNVPPPLDITTTSLSDGTVNEAYSATLQATGGTPSYSWAITAGVLPDGVSLDQFTGVISGTPTTVETKNFTVTVTDAANPSATDSQDLSIAIAAAAQGDAVTITKANYSSRKGELILEATSSASPAATLTAYYDNMVLLGQLDYNSKKDKYIRTFTMSSRPGTVTVTSSAGGSATTSDVGGR